MHKLLLVLSFGAFVLFSGQAAAGAYDDILAAANNGRNQEVIDLLRRGLDVNTADRDGSSLLTIAARTGNLALVDVLLEGRASVHRVNRYGDTALHLAASQGHTLVAARLVESGASLNSEGWTPLHYAVFGGHLPIVELLIRRGASLEARAPNGRTALMLASQLGNEGAVKLLLLAGAERTATDYEGLSASRIARDKGFAALADLLDKE